MWVLKFPINLSSAMAWITMDWDGIYLISINSVQLKNDFWNAEYCVIWSSGCG